MHSISIRKMTKICLAVFTMFLIPISVMAETAEMDEMQLVANNWLNYMTFQHGQWAGSDNPEITGYDEIVMNDTVIARCYNVSPTGYIIVPVLKDLPPVMACSEENDFDLTPGEVYGFPAMMRDVLQHRSRLFVDYYGSLEAIQTEKGDRISGVEHQQEWQYFLTDEKVFLDNLTTKAVRAMDEFGPLLASNWHQNGPYYNDCPIGDGGRAVVGCVATAASQILNYYQWPPEGTGDLTYYWYGDNSCGGSTDGALLSADFNDSYDWENIHNSHSIYDSPEEQAAVAELCYETGVAFMMDYGACGSGAYTADAADVFPTFFRYHDWIEIHERADYGPQAWSNILMTEAEQGRPWQYRIYLHSIVGDGWRQVETLTQVHMNYGWGGSHNAWYTIDDLHCNWEGCSPMEEFAVTKIEPDQGVHFSADTTWGDVPLAVQFDGLSDLVVDSWKWDFGDGDSAFEKSPIHTYESPGRYDVTVEINSGGQISNYHTIKYITVLADTLIGMSAKGDPGGTVELVIYGRNTVPLQSLRIPLEYGGDLGLVYSSFSTDGCRTNYFDQKKQISFDPLNNRMTFSLLNNNIATPDLEAGYGPVLKVYFIIPSGATADQTAVIELDGYQSYMPAFFGPVIDFNPTYINASITLDYVCGDADHDGIVNLLDVTYLIKYLYNSGPDPVPSSAGDANGSGTSNLLDITYLLDYLYKGGPGPVCP